MSMANRVVGYEFALSVQLHVRLVSANVVLFPRLLGDFVDAALPRLIADVSGADVGDPDAFERIAVFAALRFGLGGPVPAVDGVFCVQRNVWFACSELKMYSSALPRILGASQKHCVWRKLSAAAWVAIKAKTAA